MTSFTFIAVIAICSQVEVSSSSSQSTLTLMDELYKNIYRDDDPHMKDKLPIANLSSNTSLQVNTRFRVSHLYEIAPSKQMLDVRLWIVMRWKNELMVWNDTTYGIKSVYLNPEKIWKPKIVVPQSLSGVLAKFTEESSNAIVMSNGETVFDAAVRMQIHCKMISCYFPMDKHKCNISLLIVNYDESEVKFVADPTPLSAEFVTEGNGLWRIEEGKATVSSQDLSDDFVISRLVKDLILEQQPAYYYGAIIVPVTLICMVMLCALLLPAASSDRMALLVTCFLAEIVNLDVIFKLLPQTSDYVPYIATFTMIVLVFTVLQLILSCLTVFFEENVEKFQIAEALLQKVRRYIKQAKRTKIRDSAPVIHVKESDNNQRGNNQHEGQNETDAATNNGIPSEQRMEDEDVLVFRLLHIFSVISVVWMTVISLVVFMLAYKRVSSFLCSTSNQI